MCNSEHVLQLYKMSRLCKHILSGVFRSNKILNRSFPTFVQTKKFATLDDDGDLSAMKTTVTILNKEQDGGIFIDAYSNQGFRLNTGFRVIGPCAVFPRSILHWNVKDISDVNEDSLSLFTMLDPKIDVLVLGVGERENLGKINPSIMKYLRSKRVSVEILSTDQALSTFNFLNSEKRYVAGAFIPPSYMESSENDYYHSMDDPNSLHGDIFTDDSHEEGQLEDRLDLPKQKDFTQEFREKIHGKDDKKSPGD